MKYLVPLARANVEDCLKLSEAIAGAKLSTREVGELYSGWVGGNDTTRDLVVTDPVLFLRAREEAVRDEPAEKPPAQALIHDLGALAGIARRTSRRLKEGLAKTLSEPEHEEADLALRQANADCEALFRRWEKERNDARPKQPHGHP
jgi:hypothetical protein